MFERYTEKARRTIFFARYEASQAGSPYIETEHLLLGLLRENEGTMRQHLKVNLSTLTDLLRAKRFGAKISTSVDLPLDDASKRALAYAAAEAEQLGHKFIGTEHLLLGVMREEQSGAAKALKELNAASLAEVRKAVVESGAEEHGRGVFGTGSARLPTYVKFIEEDTGREFQARLGFETVPRVGEAVVVSAPEDGTLERFRVLDVAWSFDVRSLGKDLALKVVEVRLKREQPAR